MLKFSKTRIHRSVERPVLSGQDIASEGLALIGDTVSGVFGVQASGGASGERFMGVSLVHTLSQTSLAFVDEASVPASAPYTIQLTNTPSGGTLRVVGATTGVIAAGNPATTTGEYSVSGDTLTFHVDQAGEAMTIQYRYAPTVQQLQYLQGEAYPAASAFSVTGTAGVIEVGDVYTSEYDTTLDWSANPDVTLGANGLFTTGGNVTLSNVIVIQVPSADDPFLGLRLQ